MKAVGAFLVNGFAAVGFALLVFVALAVWASDDLATWASTLPNVTFIKCR